MERSFRATPCDVIPDEDRQELKPQGCDTAPSSGQSAAAKSWRRRNGMCVRVLPGRAGGTPPDALVAGKATRTVRRGETRHRPTSPRHTGVSRNRSRYPPLAKTAIVTSTHLVMTSTSGYIHPHDFGRPIPTLHRASFHHPRSSAALPCTMIASDQASYKAISRVRSNSGEGKSPLPLTTVKSQSSAQFASIAEAITSASVERSVPSWGSSFRVTSPEPSRTSRVLASLSSCGAASH